MGVQRRTIENLQVVRVDAERNLLLIRGAVPGAPGGQVIVRPSVKALCQLRRKHKPHHQFGTHTVKLGKVRRVCAPKKDTYTAKSRVSKWYMDFDAARRRWVTSG
jgi:hypothetical protein